MVQEIVDELNKKTTGELNKLIPIYEEAILEYEEELLDMDEYFADHDEVEQQYLYLVMKLHQAKLIEANGKRIAEAGMKRKARQ